MKLPAKEKPFSKFCTSLFAVLRAFVSHNSFPWIPWDMSKGSSYGDCHNFSRRISCSCCVKGHLLSVKLWKKMKRYLGSWGKAVYLFYMLNLTKILLFSERNLSVVKSHPRLNCKHYPLLHALYSYELILFSLICELIPKPNH